MNQFVGFWGVPAGRHRGSSPQGVKMWLLTRFVAWTVVDSPCQRMERTGQVFSEKLGFVDAAWWHWAGALQGSSSPWDLPEPSGLGDRFLLGAQ